MIKQSPSPGKLVAMVAFALSCVAILLYLWLTFGGSVPLRAEGYRFTIKFPEATQLAQEADVRISGVNVGKVKTKSPDRQSGLTSAVLEVDSRYAPIPSDTRAILRQKTLLGETYVELSPGDQTKWPLADGGTLSLAQVAPTVELDEIFRAFDPKTRRAFSTWLDSQGRGVEQGGAALNRALAQLTPFAEDVDDVLRILRRQDGATRGFVRDTGVVFDALSERSGQLQGLVTNSNRVFETTAARDRQLADTFVAFPTFLREARTTSRRLTRFAQDTDPLVTQLRPAARELSPALQNVQAIAPDLRGLFTDLGPLIRVSGKGLPALDTVLDDSRPLLARFEPYLRTLQPTFDYLGLYKREITALLGNAAGATQAVDPGTNTTRLVHYLRTTNPISPEVLATYEKRLPTNRSNPYPEPGAYSQLASGLPTFGNYLCANPGPATSLAPPERNPLLTDNIRRLVEKYAYTPRGVTAPACREQRNLGRLVDQAGRFPQLRPIQAP